MPNLTLQDLERSEAIIKSGLRMFFEVGAELLKIKNDELYRLRGYDTWKDYCKGQWGWTTQHAGRLVRAAEVVSELQSEPIGSLPTSEGVARELGRIPITSDRPRIWQMAINAFGSEPTAAQVRKVVDELYPQTPESPPSADGASMPSAAPDALANVSGDSPAPTEAEQTLKDRRLKPEEMVSFESGLGGEFQEQYLCFGDCGNFFYAEKLRTLDGNRYCYSCREELPEADLETPALPLYETTLFDEPPPEPSILPDANGTLLGSNGQAIDADPVVMTPIAMTEQDPYDEMLSLADDIFPLLSKMEAVRTYGIYGPLSRFIELFRQIHQLEQE